MDLCASTRTYLFFCILLTGFSDSRTEWSTRNSSIIRISGGDCAGVRTFAFLVRADVALVFEQLAHADSAVLGRYCGFVASGRKCVATCNADGLLCLLSFFCQRSWRFFWVSV